MLRMVLMISTDLPVISPCLPVISPDFATEIEEGLVTVLALPVISPANAEDERAKVNRDAQRTDLMRVMSNSPVDCVNVGGG